MNARRIFRPILWCLLAIALVLGLVVGSLWLYFHPALTRTNGIVYTQRNHPDLTFDVVRSSRPNGIGIVLMISGGWRSRPGGFRPFM